jgi:hypothetical protein
MNNWTLFSNHGHVLVCLAQDNRARLRDVAAAVGITERAVQKIVRDLQDSDMISVRKHGRRNRYDIRGAAPLRHALEAHCKLDDLLRLVDVEKDTPVAGGQRPSAEEGGTAESPAAEPAPVSAPARTAKKDTGAARRPGKAATETDSTEKKQGNLF